MVLSTDSSFHRESSHSRTGPSVRCTVEFCRSSDEFNPSKTSQPRRYADHVIQASLDLSRRSLETPRDTSLGLFFLEYVQHIGDESSESSFSGNHVNGRSTLDCCHHALVTSAVYLHLHLHLHHLLRHYSVFRPCYLRTTYQ